MFNILPTQCIDAVLIKIQSYGKHSFHRVVWASVRSNGALELVPAPDFIAGARSADVTTVMLMPERWMMERFHHIYHFRRLNDPNIKPTDTFISAYILSPRP